MDLGSLHLLWVSISSSVKWGISTDLPLRVLVFFYTPQGLVFTHEALRTPGCLWQALMEY